LSVPPPDRSTITEQTTPEFRHDLDRLSPDERERVHEALRRSYELLREDPRSFFARVGRPSPIHLKGGLHSSLYKLGAGRDIRLILAVDDDPIFGQTIVTLFRAVRRDQVERSYRSVARLLYNNHLERNGGAQ
jgi:mRNA-degrading endonuclease RelE of RelBE toxin-antitoxin system